MMIRSLFVVAVTALVFPQAVLAQAYPVCDVEVQFKSTCCGIDQKTETRIMELLRGSPLVDLDRSRRDFWGREGERTYCVYFKDVTQAEKDGFLVEIRQLIRKGRPTNHAQTEVVVPHSEAE